MASSVAAETASQFSETESIVSTAARFTCLSCQVAFASAEAQRTHMRTDWHRYNLKRKAADLPPVTALVFAQKLQDQQSKLALDARRALFSASCAACGKSYASENAYQTHLASRKHKDAVAALARSNPQAAHNDPKDQAPKDQAPKDDAAPSWHDRLAAATTEDEVEQILREKMATARKLSETDCLFCPNSAESFELNLTHMADIHSFFIPDIEYISDAKGLIKYLADKIAIANICIFCNGKGRALHSIEAVQHHMVSKGHCKMVYEDGQDAEYEDFYDFSAAYDDNDDDEIIEYDEDAEDADDWEDADDDDDDNEDDEDNDDDVDMDDEDDNNDDEDDDMGQEDSRAKVKTSSRRRPTSAAVLSEDGTQLVLPSGTRVGHRDFRTYWKQNVRLNEVVPGSMRDPEMLQRMSGRYKMLGYSPTAQGYSTAVSLRQKHQMVRERQADALKYARQEQQFRTKIGFIKNNQKHFLDPNRPS